MSSYDIDIRTDRGDYVGGDTVYGSVYLNIKQHVPCTTLKLLVRGYEICEYDYQYVQQNDVDTYQPKISKRASKKDIVKVDFNLVEYNAGFPVGAYVYPFMYQLPHNLPGVFHTRNEDMDSGRIWEGVIKYGIGAGLEMPEGLQPEHKLPSCEVPLVVFDNLECRNTHIAPDIERGVGGVKTFFCIHRGTVQVTSRLECSAYTPKDQITVNVDIVNDSAVDVLGSSVRLIRVIKLYGLDRSRDEQELSAHTIYDTVLEVEHDGCNKNTTRSCKVVLDLSQFSEGIGIPPSTSGTIVKCSYVVDVDVHVPWAPDIEVRQPLLIKPPSNSAWETWKPAVWVGSCVQAMVTGACAVPPDILCSQSFSGIPGFQPLL